MILRVFASWLIFAFVMIFTGLALAGGLVLLMARKLLHPGRMTDGRATVILQRLSPGDLSLPFEEIRFIVRDERTGKQLSIATWWIPAPASQPASSRTMLLIHGRADAKVGAIAWAPTLHALGWNLFVIDLRAHGESGGRESTAGYWERHDVAQLINQMQTARPELTQTVAIFGVSLGAAVAVAVAAMREDIAALILESPFADYRRAIAAHGQMQGFGGGPLRTAAVRLAEWMSGADFHAVRPSILLKEVKCPIMVIRSADDPFIPPDDAQAMNEALRARNNPADVLWSIPAAGHVLGLPTAGPDEYRARIDDFLKRLPGVSEDETK